MSQTRNPNESLTEKQDRVFDQKEGDIFLKHDETDSPSAIVIREESIVAFAKEGKTGILIKSAGEMIFQGRIKVNAASKEISRFTGGQFSQEVTENPKSTKKYTYLGGSKVTDIGGFPPHTHTIFDHSHELEPGYLRKMPNTDILKYVYKNLESFLKK